MKKLIGDSDLGIPYTTPVNRAIVNAARSLLGINKINELYDKIPESRGADFARGVLAELGVEVKVGGVGVDRIPASGAFIVVVNHPHGALDGLMLIDIIARVRPDVKLLGNFLLTKIEELNDLFLPFDKFDANDSRNISGVRKAVEHLESGAPLVIFPAGEVSTFQRGFARMEDKPWSKSMMKFIYKAQVPIVPIYIDGSNSLMFHLLGKIHPILRTVRLPRELTNKRGRAVSVAIASPLTVRSQSEFESQDKFSHFLRTNVYILRAAIIGDVTTEQEADHSSSAKTDSAPLVSHVPSRELAAEIAKLPPSAKLFESGSMQLYCAPVSMILLTMVEIKRLREENLRAMGEGANNASNFDKYDLIYEHLFLWDAENKRVVGSYWVGFGDKLMRKGGGFEGFYTYTMFEYSRQMNEMLNSSIELGPLFIAADYQRHPLGLVLLWRGVLALLISRPKYRYLMGPVSMSGHYSAASKWVIINYIKQNFWQKEFAKWVVPRNGLSVLGRPQVSQQLIRGISRESLIDKLLRDIEPGGAGIPVLIRKYLQLSGRVLAFNIDPDFNDSLDALLMVDLRNISREKIDLVAHEFADSFTRDQVYDYFRGLGNVNV